MNAQDFLDAPPPAPPSSLGKADDFLGAPSDAAPMDTGVSMTAMPSILDEVQAGNIRNALHRVYEPVREQFSGLIGPTEEQRLNDSVPFGKNADGSDRYEYKPLGNRMDQEAGLATPFIPVPHFDAAPGDGTATAIGKAVLNTGAGFAGFMESPLGAMLGGLARPASLALDSSLANAAHTAFRVDMAANIPDQVKQAYSAPTLQGRIEGGVGAVASGLMAGPSSHALLKGEDDTAAPAPASPDPAAAPAAAVPAAPAPITPSGYPGTDIGGVITDLRGDTHTIHAVDADGTALTTAPDGSTFRWTPDILKRLVAKGGSVDLPREAASTPAAAGAPDDEADPAAPIPADAIEPEPPAAVVAPAPPAPPVVVPDIPNDQPLVSAAAKAAAVAESVEDVAPATADALRQKTSQAVVDRTDPDLLTPDAAVPPAPVPAETQSQLPAPIEPTPNLPTASPLGSAEEFLQGLPPGTDGTGTSTGAETPESESVPGESDEAAAGTPEPSKESAETVGGVASGDVTGDIPPAQPESLAPPEVPAEAADQSPQPVPATPPDDSDSPASAPTGQQDARLDDRGKPIKVIDSDAADAVVLERDPAKGSRTTSPEFQLSGAKTKFLEATMKRPAFPNEDSILGWAHARLDSLRPKLRDDLSGFLDFHPDDRIVDDAISRFHRQLRDNKIDPDATGQPGQKPNAEQALKTIIESSKADFLRRVDVRSEMRPASLDEPVGSEGSAKRQDFLPAPDDEDRAERAMLAGLKVDKLVDGFLETKPEGATRSALVAALQQIHEPETLSAKQKTLLKQFQDYAQSTRRSERPSAAESVDDTRAPDDPQGQPAADDSPNGGSESVREQAASEPTGQRGEGEPPARSEPAPAGAPDAGGTPEGKAGFEPRAGERVSHKGRAFDVQNIDGETATGTYKGSKRAVKVPTAELKPAIVRTFKLPDAPAEQPDIIDRIAEARGMKGSVAAARSDEGKGINTKDLYNDRPDLKGIYQRKVFGGTMTPDKMATGLLEDHQLGDGTVGTMYDMIREAMQSRESAKAEADRQATLEKQHDDFTKDVREGKRGEKKVTAESLSVGDTLTMDNGEKLTVTDLDEEGNVELSDGDKYGIQEVKPGEVVWFEKRKVAPKVSDDGWLNDAEETPRRSQT